MGGLTEINRLIQEAYTKEQQVSGDGNDPFSPLVSLHSLTAEQCNEYLFENEDKVAQLRPQITRARIIFAWKSLMDALMQNDAFHQHSKMIKKGYKAFVDGSLEPDHYIHAETLLQLLAHTAQNALRDYSTECRYVTLLEILLSYSPNWDPSDDVSRLWIRLMQRIPYQCAPINFRRKAYRVLVSLSWVPSSHKGLLAACSIDERPMDPVRVPKSSETWRSASTGAGNVPRYDCVNQLLDRLKDETDVCVAITSEHSGTGKGTLASLVVSHPSIQKSFHVVWIRLMHPDDDIIDDPSISGEEAGGNDNEKSEGSSIRTQNGMSFRTYCEYICQIRDQINGQIQNGEGDDGGLIEIEFPRCERRFEEPALRLLRERKAIEETKRRVAKALYGRNLLLVLENIPLDTQIPLFRFHDKQSLIITTTETELKNVDWKVEMDLFHPQEAVDLFLAEAGLPLDHPIGQTRELATVLSSSECCNFHPLLIRTTARWCRLKAISAGPLQGFMEVLREIHSLPTGSDSQSPDAMGEDGTHATTRFLFDILSLMMGPSRKDNGQQTTSAVFVVCLAAMAVVFPGPRRVPLDAVLLLWEQILVVEPLAADEVAAATAQRNKRNSALERRRYVGLIAQGLIHMGLIEIYQLDDQESPWIEIHHEMYATFALAMAQELDLGDSFEHTVQEWHKSFVTAYFEHRIQSGTSEVGGKNALEYALKNLPTHIFQANIPAMAETILTDTNFFHSRVETLGWDRAMEIHLQDCMQLQSDLDGEMDLSSDVLVVSPVFPKTAEMIASFAEPDDDEDDVEAHSSEVVEIASALYKMAFSLAEHGYFEDALAQFEAAQNFKPDSSYIQACIHYGMAWVLLVSGDSKRALRKIITSLKFMKEMDDKHELYIEARQLHVDTLIERCEYKKALKYLIEIEKEILEESDKYRIELGTSFKRKGSLQHCMGEGKKALESIQSAIEWKEAAEEYSYGLAHCYSHLADLNTELHSSSAAKENLQKALLTLSTLKCDPEHISYLLATGKLRFLRNDFARCFVSLEFAREAIGVTPLYLMDQSAYDLRCIGRMYQSQGNFETAIQIFQESLALTVHRPNSLERSACLLDIGKCYLEHNEFEEGLECLKDSLIIKTTCLGQTLQLVDILNTIGRVHRVRREYSDSLDMYAAAEEILQQIASGNTEKQATVLFSVAVVKEDQGDFEGGMKASQKAMAMLIKDHASDDMAMAKAHHFLGRSLSLLGNLDEARRNLEAAVSIRKKNFDHQALANSLRELGVVLRKQGLYDLSETALKDSNEVFERTDAHADHARTLFELGNLARLQSKSNIAITFYDSCLNKLDSSDSLKGDVYQAIGHAKFFTKKEDEAMLFYRRALDLRKTEFGLKHRKSAASLRCIGLTQLLFKQTDEAINVLSEVLQVTHHLNTEEIFRRVDETRRDYVVAAIFLGDAYYANRQCEEARSLWLEAERVCIEIASEDSNTNLPTSIVEMYESRLRQGDLVSDEEPLPAFDLEEVNNLAPYIFVDD